MIKNDQWVWVIIQNPGVNEALLGQYDEQNDTSFIPVFTDRVSAEKALEKLVLEKKYSHEIQAILYEDLVTQVVHRECELFVLGNDGTIIEQITLDNT